MKNNRKFIKGNYPLTNRIWFKLDEEFTCELVYENIKQHLEGIPELMSLEVGLYITKSSKIINKNLFEMLNNIDQFKVGYEKSFPIVSIYYPYQEISQDFVEQINALDRYRPGLNLYLLVRENNLPEIVDLCSLRDMANNIFQKWRMANQVGLSASVYLFLEEKEEKLDSLLKLRKLIYTWDTSYDMPAPLVQVAPNFAASQDAILKLNEYIESDPDIINIINTICGLTSMIYRFKEQQNIHATIIPLGGCGAPISEKTFYTNGKASHCFFTKNTIETDFSYKTCEECTNVSTCTGCLLQCVDGEKCNINHLFNQI